MFIQIQGCRRTISHDYKTSILCQKTRIFHSIKLIMSLNKKTFSYKKLVLVL